MKLPIFVFLLAVVTSPASAQYVLLARDGAEEYQVVAVRGQSLVVLKEGKLAKIRASSYRMVQVEEYLPLNIEARNIDALSKYRYSSRNSSDHFNKKFNFNCELVSDEPIEDVFIVLITQSAVQQPAFFINEVGRLKGKKPRSLSFEVPLQDDLQGFRYTVHLFVKGREVFSSLMSADYIKDCLKKMVLSRTKDLRNAPPKLLYCPSLGYPKEQWDRSEPGSVLMTIKINDLGEVEGSEIVRASSPEFGNAASAAVRQWRFLPRVVDGDRVACTISLPIDFARSDN